MGKLFINNISDKYIELTSLINFWELLFICGFLRIDNQEFPDLLSYLLSLVLLKKNFSVEKISEIIKNREPNYNKAHKIIDTDSKTPYNIAQEILGVLNDRNKD